MIGWRQQISHPIPRLAICLVGGTIYARTDERSESTTHINRLLSFAVAEERVQEPGFIRGYGACSKNVRLIDIARHDAYQIRGV